MPRHRHRIRDIAALSGVSEATVDRVLHERGTVSSESLQAVRAAIVELDRQRTTTEEGTRRLTIEVIAAQRPERVDALRLALHQLRPLLRPHVEHTFVRTVPRGQPELGAAMLGRAIARRPQGVLVDLEDHPAVLEQAAAVSKAGIPVVTTDRRFPRSAALGHSGLDHRAAGATAAYLLSRGSAGERWTIAHAGAITAVAQDRVDAFVRVGAELGVDVSTLAASALGGSGTPLRMMGVYLPDDDQEVDVVRAHLQRLPSEATVVAHRSAGVLDLLTRRTVGFVLDTDWSRVVAEGCEAILRFHRRGPGQAIVTPTPPLVLTPFNVP